MSATFSVVDLIFFTFTAIFVFTAFFRGFTKEIFSLLNWVISLTLSYFLTPYINNFFFKHFSNKLVVDIAVRSIIFILVFFITAISTSGLRDSLKEKIPKAFDRSLGVLFGFVKTLIIFGFIYSLYFNLYGSLLGKGLKQSKEMKVPQWLESAKCYSLLKLSGEALDPLVKNFFDSVTENFDRVLPDSEDPLDKKIEEITTDKMQERDEETSSNFQIKNDKKESGYSKKDIEKMNHLIEIIDQ